MEMKDFLEMKALEGNGLSPYEQYKIGFMQNKNHTSGIGVAGLVLGTVGTAVGLGAWLFGGMYGSAKANAAKDTAVLLANSNQRQLDQLTNLFAAERSERLQGDFTLNQTITDTVSGQQASTLTAQQAAELSAIQTATNTVTAGLMTGQYSQNPQKVALYRDAQACGCPGCGCNG